MQDAGATTITLAMVTDAMKMSGIDLTDAELKAMVDSANQNLKRYQICTRSTSPTTSRRRITSARSSGDSPSTSSGCRSC